MKNCEEFYKSMNFSIIELYRLICKKFKKKKICAFPYKYIKV